MSILNRIRTRAGHTTIGNALYDWTLGGSAPRGFLTPLSDMWPGDATRGRRLCGYSGPDLDTAEEGEEPLSPAALHGFDWLRDLRALGGDQARREARAMTENWLHAHGSCRPDSWNADSTALRIANWIMLYDFFGASADDEFQQAFFDSLMRQARHLSRTAGTASPGIGAMGAARGLIFAGIALEGRESWLEQGLDLLQEEMEKQILPDGGHVSRSPAILQETLRIVADIRMALAAGGYPVPLGLANSIDRMAQALRFFRYADRRYAVFHGAREGDPAMIDAVLARCNARGKPLRNLPQTGFERLVVGRSQLMVDCSPPPPSPYDRTAHASPLAFEFIYGKERVFVSCGSHPSDPAWREPLRGTAAHNTLSLDGRDACEIREDGHFGRKQRRIIVTREESKDAMLLEGAHDGYTGLNGVTHRRRLYLGNQGHDLRGEETMTCGVGLARPAQATLRFHLHPRVLVSLIQDGREALLRLPGGAGWRFFHNVGTLSLENGIYLGDGLRPRKTKQLVITGAMDSDRALIKWALQREGR